MRVPPGPFSPSRGNPRGQEANGTPAPLASVFPLSSPSAAVRPQGSLQDARAQRCEHAIIGLKRTAKRTEGYQTSHGQGQEDVSTTRPDLTGPVHISLWTPSLLTRILFPFPNDRSTGALHHDAV